MKIGPIALFVAAVALLASCSEGTDTNAKVKPIAASERVENLLSQMTVEEKLGQLTQAAGGRSKNLNSKLTPEELDRVRAGRVGSYLHVAGAEPLMELQRVAVEESRLGIPLLFAMDVVHGYRTIYPVPIGIASSWEPDLWEEVARASAVEASAGGLHWTFAPMVDVSQDPRWGRIVEGAGEDPYLGSEMTRAQVSGYQGDDLSDPETILATTKHYGAYGAPTGGRDYGSADISERSLNEIYLPPFYAANDAGTASYMVAFNDIGGVPSTANADLIDGLLREDWGFQGVVLSDWNAIFELTNHGVAETRADAAALAIQAGVDMDMMSLVYADDLGAALEDDEALMPYIDNAVRRILTVKEDLGLFDTPFAYHDVDREAAVTLSQAHRELARRSATRSIVLLKNEGDILPLDGGVQSIAVIGALAKDTQSQLGSWRARGLKEDVVSLYDGIKAAAGENVRVSYAAGAAPQSDDLSGLSEAVTVANASDLVVLVIGEDYDLSGEARSRSDITLPASQSALAEAVFDTGKPVIVVLTGGRTLAIPEIDEGSDALLMTWLLGVEAGPALGDILFGNAAPGGKLPAAFPRRTGQVPFSYSEYPSGRPADPDVEKDTNRYLDLPITPLYPFGHGLSYASFDVSDAQLSGDVLEADGEITISVKLTNMGDRRADETVQLYLRDPVAKVARPKMMLRGFKRLSLGAGESRTVSFTLTAGQLAYYDKDGDWRTDAGDILYMIGTSAEDIRQEGRFSVAEASSSRVPAAAIMTKVDVE